MFNFNLNWFYNPGALNFCPTKGLEKVFDLKLAALIFPPLESSSSLIDFKRSSEFIVLAVVAS